MLIRRIFRRTYKKLLNIFLCLLIITSSCVFPMDGYNYRNTAFAEGDLVAPVVNITSPANGSTVSDLVYITANATDAVGVSKVEFYVDGILVGESSSAPYGYGWQSTVGQHTLVAKAYDAAGNVGTSSSVSVSVPAKVTITNPVDGSSVSGVISNFTATFSGPVVSDVGL